MHEERQLNKKKTNSFADRKEKPFLIKSQQKLLKKLLFLSQTQRVSYQNGVDSKRK